MVNIQTNDFSFTKYLRTKGGQIQAFLAVKPVDKHQSI